MNKSSQDIDQKICDTLLEISNKTKSIAENLKKLNEKKGEKDVNGQRAIHNRTRAKAV